MKGKATRKPPGAAASVRKRIGEGSALAKSAAIEYRVGTAIRGAELHLAAELACGEIGKAIVKLTEQEADLVEPMFTGLEDQLLNLRALRFCLLPG
jgi:predicted component of type VI protein secretion system